MEPVTFANMQMELSSMNVGECTPGLMKIQHRCAEFYFFQLLTATIVIGMLTA